MINWFIYIKMNLNWRSYYEKSENEETDELLFRCIAKHVSVDEGNSNIDKV